METASKPAMVHLNGGKAEGLLMYPPIFKDFE